MTTEHWWARMSTCWLALQLVWSHHNTVTSFIPHLFVQKMFIQTYPTWLQPKVKMCHISEFSGLMPDSCSFHSHLSECWSLIQYVASRSHSETSNTGQRVWKQLSRTGWCLTLPHSILAMEIRLRLHFLGHLNVGRKQQIGMLVHYYSKREIT